MAISTLVLMSIGIAGGIAIYYGRIIPLISKYIKFKQKWLLATSGFSVLQKYFTLCKKLNRTPWEGYVFWGCFSIASAAMIIDWTMQHLRRPYGW